MNKKVGRLYQASQNIGEKITSLRQDIQNGEATLGSKFDNFVFCFIGANPVDWEPFYRLDEQMKSSGGEEILIVRSHEKPFEPYIHYMEPEFGQTNGGPSMKLTRTDYEMSYGVLTGKGLDFDLDASKIIFPSGRKHVRASANSVSSSSLTFEPLEIKRGRIREKVGDLTHLYESCNIEGLMYLGHVHISQILVGSEVDQYFENIIHGEKVYSEIRKKL